MTATPRSEVKWDVPTPELLKELMDAPPPDGLRVKRTTHGFHRDIYYDTADGSLARRDVTCRFRLGADDRARAAVLRSRRGPGPVGGAPGGE
jgi:adenylate cyclase class IV